MPSYRDFTRQPHTRAAGRSAEEAAVAWLERQGYAIEARNHTTRAGELDVVARDGDTLCFLEIKARESGRFGSPLRAVDWKKRRRLARAAALYLAEGGWRGPCRFDVLAMTGGPGGWHFDLVQDAFELP